jgi:dTMP kinase
MFITFEGIEGCGKTTQIRLLAEDMTRRGLDCIATREPGGTSIGEAIRGIFLHCTHDDMLPITELLLVTAARVQHVEQVIKPNLKAGKIVLCDRYVDATVAYQGFAAGLGHEMVMRSHSMFVEALMPELTILLDCPVELGLVRSRERNRATGKEVDEGRFEELDQSFHERVRQGYLDQAAREPERFNIVRAEGTPEEIQCRISQAVLQRLSGAGYAL